MKKILLRTAVFFLTFFVVLVVASRVLNKDHDNMTMEMGQATLPVVVMLCEDLPYNRLFGYTVPMDYPSQRDCLTILAEGRNIDFLISAYGREITKVEAQLRSTDGERLIEVVELQGNQEGENTRVTLSLKDLIEEKTEYLLILQLEADGWQEISYYTRVVWDGTAHLKEELAFITDFHEKLYHREAAKELVKYLESNSRLESNSSFHKVNIHSSFKQITWGDLKVTETQAPVFSLKELNSQSGSFVADYQVTVKDGAHENKYRMREYFRVRFTADRMYLLDYERTMTQIPKDDRLYGGDKILLGIADENVSMTENQSGSILAFQQADCLYAYQGNGQKLIRVFQFYDDNVMDVRNEHDEHDIKILKVDDEGNIDFAVYGYMNRGDHEGEVGIRICRYDTNVNVVEEKAFLPWNKPYSNLQAQMRELLYLGEEGNLYLFLDKAVYRVNLENGEQEQLMAMQLDDCMQVSGDHQILVWQDGEYSSEIYVQDLKLGSRKKLSAGYGESLRILGFMDQDIIYGIAKKEQISREAGGQLFFPVYKLCIAKTDGTVVKEYAQENLYVTDCSVEDNQIVLERVEWKENGKFVPAPQDHITRTQKTVSMKNSISLVDIDVFERFVQIQVAKKSDAKGLQLLGPKEVVQEGKHETRIALASAVRSYSVFGPYGVEGIYQSAGNAVNLADEIAGVVVSSQGEVVWQKGNMASRNQILSIKEPEKVSAEESLAQCLDVMMAQRGITIDSTEFLARGKSPLEIMQNVTTMSPVDMTGCRVETMLYFINQDIPVLSILQGGEAVLITGYNETQIVVFQPAAGKLHKMGKKDADKWFSENGNCFLTFLTGNESVTVK